MASSDSASSSISKKVVQPYTSITANILLTISEIQIYVTLQKKTAINTNGCPRHLNSVSVFHMSFALFTSFEQFINLKWLLKII